MKKILIFIVLSVLMTSCSNNYREGRPVVVKKTKNIFPNSCRFAWEGYGKREYFDDDCDKYDIGAPINLSKD